MISMNDKELSGVLIDRLVPMWTPELGPGQPCSGDTLVVPSLDRLARSLADLVTIVAELRRRGVGFRSLKEALDTTRHGPLCRRTADSASRAGEWRLIPEVSAYSAADGALVDGIPPRTPPARRPSPRDQRGVW
uniref:recombinase family protein n=1 Tax=Nonomuraea pusilla TaxID=46177 RepID=UPI0009EA6AE9